jgi:hypothetical protein
MLAYMKKLEGRFAYLPDGQKVRIESVFNGFATVRRFGGRWHRRIAVCAIASLHFK